MAMENPSERSLLLTGNFKTLQIYKQFANYATIIREMIMKKPENREFLGVVKG